MKIKQDRYGDIWVDTFSSVDIKAIQQYGKCIEVEPSSIPALCAALMGVDVRALKSYMEPIRALSRSYRNIDKYIEPDHSETDKPEPEKPVCRICGATIEAIKSGPDKPEPDEKWKNPGPPVWVVWDGDGFPPLSKVRPGAIFKYEPPNPAFSEPEFEFEWQGLLHKIVDEDGKFVVFREQGAGLLLHWVRVSIEDRPKSFLAKVLPWMQARLDYRKKEEWTCGI